MRLPVIWRWSCGICGTRYPTARQARACQRGVHKHCSLCGLVGAADEIFCERDGSRLVRANAPHDAEGGRG
ncbi:hypothetical protein [Sulfobacillus harzensis]|uniref:Uncharacterized protein n=1 Tax=Sulfobacillus harzensis TaxID=2729629 RepID=A0A7Y0Q4K5_9FIRM|nr:hypothetical protein [Sulfobacillus harzensis]NMP24515.1 hypothetical protein [Sulfobacillus harzensis]